MQTTVDVIGKDYFMMEKLDGIFLYWMADLRCAYTRAGNPIDLPEFILKQMPPISVTGEIYAGRKKFNIVQGLVASAGGSDSDSMWKNIQLCIFDVVDNTLTSKQFTERLAILTAILADCKVNRPNVCIVQFTAVESVQQIDAKFLEITTNDGEGLILRKDVAYKTGRSNDILKYKKEATMDAKVMVTIQQTRHRVRKTCIIRCGIQLFNGWQEPCTDWQHY